MANGIGSKDVGHCAEASSENFQRIRQGAPCCLILTLYTVAANSLPGSKCDVCDSPVYCLVIIIIIYSVHSVKQCICAV